MEFIAPARTQRVHSRRRAPQQRIQNCIGATGAGEHEVSGAVLGNHALRLTRIDGYRFEVVPEGYFLMLHNRDVPGVVGAVGTMLGQAGINIGGLELGRDRVGGTALSIFEVDEPVPSAVLDKLKTLPAITAASLLKL